MVMRYYRVDNNGYLTMIGTGTGGTEITEEEYNNIIEVLKNKPTPTDTTDYMLKSDLTWESYEVEPVIIDEDLTAEEIAEALAEVLS